ncbi:DNA-binding HxlR family transcriptional regulator [Nocardioides luteus]|uniref:HxlR family transcriptional regulator n=1 Tax=Nocardioides luteus TaxID=1844 RepID=A0ABQ5SSZ8_9ACTN|nr:helix-turn-helix domain-containing protein [Nocardioides luteus]MDR7310047.1 DNA-binding HxlR family transcriptional regulator [Nocardioides luteus]GGR65158.1 HxlR family transcriptional regulator [Nocardioides luteus]GLJ67044.1 HxlR family transcriptional regulator [Nocardioides luteus]
MPDVPAVASPRECTIADALEIVGDRWSLLVVRELFYDQLRFSQIARNTGAPRDVLTVRLRKLVEHGVIAREQYSERPVRYEYRLTRAGRALSPVLLTLKRWGSDHARPGPDPAPFAHSCGEEFVAHVHCRACGERLAAGDLSPGAARRADI